MSKKRLTVLLNGFGLGGAQQMVYELVSQLDSECIDTQILCYGKRDDTELEKKVEDLYPTTYLGIDGSITPRSVLRVLAALRKSRADLVHAHLGGAGFGAIWSLVYRKPLVITVHAVPKKAFSEKIEKLVRLALRMGKTKLVAVSQENARAVKDYFGIDDRKCVCINNGINLERFIRRPHEHFTIINVARQDENKNQVALVRCFAKLHKKYPETRLLLVGDGECHEALKAQVSELGLCEVVTMPGSVSNPEDYYAVSDLYVQCSHREGLPLSVLEAMAAGLPVVSTEVGGLADAVKDNGILVPDNDEDALYRAVETVYLQPREQTEEMCRKSGLLVQAWSSEAMARAYERLYDTI